MRRVFHTLHMWIGLALCAPLVLLGLTGSVLVFEDELRGDPPQASAGAPHSATEIVAAARKAAPADLKPTVYLPATEPGRMATVRFGGTVRVGVDPVSLGTFPSGNDDLLRQVFFLHSTLLMKNRTGRQVVGFLGVAMLVMAVSGIVNWWPRANFRPGRSLPEWHGAVGIWALAVFATVSFAGVALAFPETVRGAVNLILPARDLRTVAAETRVEPVKGATPIDIDAAIAVAGAALPETRPIAVFLPAQPSRPYRVAMLRAGQERGGPAATVLVDPWRGRVVTLLDPREFSAGETMLAWQHAIHAGRGLGFGWKMLVALTGLLPLLFTVTGVAMWWRAQLWRRMDERAYDA